MPQTQRFPLASDESLNSIECTLTNVERNQSTEKYEKHSVDADNSVNSATSISSTDSGATPALRLSSKSPPADGIPSCYSGPNSTSSDNQTPGVSRSQSPKPAPLSINATASTLLPKSAQSSPNIPSKRKISKKLMTTRATEDTPPQQPPIEPSGAQSPVSNPQRVKSMSRRHSSSRRKSEGGRAKRSSSYLECDQCINLFPAGKHTLFTIPKLHDSRAHQSEGQQIFFHLPSREHRPE